MKIDLKDQSNLTFENVKLLIASKDDSEHRQLRISKDGFAYLSDDVASANLDNVLCRFETWTSGKDYCGVDASNDESWVNEVLHILKQNYPNPKSPYIDY